MIEPLTLTLNCPQRPGIVHAVSHFLFQHRCDIIEHQQFDDVQRGILFLHTGFVRAEDPDLNGCVRISNESRRNSR